MDSLIVFWQFVANLKAEKRKGWRRLSVGRVESVADHSYATAMLALYEGERRGLDVEKLLKLALLHDLEEALTGDLTPRDKTRLGFAKVKRRRESAIRRLLQSFPENSQSFYRSLWADLRLLRSSEARLVHQLDKLELALQARHYSSKAGKSRMESFYDSAASEIRDPDLERILHEVRSGSD